MTTLLQELSKKLAERWATVLIGPGLLFTACAVIAHHLGSQHALDVTELRQYATELARGRTTGDLLVIGAAITLGAVTAGLAVAGTSRIVQALWMPTAPGWYVDALTRLRAARWDRADTALANATTAARQQQARDRVLGRPPATRFPTVLRYSRRRSRIGETRPDRPTWSAQRMADAAATVRGRYALDLNRLWPHLWAVSDGEIRADIGNVQENYAASSRLAAWGAAYLLLAGVTAWWPAALLAMILILTARNRARTAVGALAVLVVAATDLHIRDMAARLGVPCDNAFTAQTAADINTVLDTNTTP